MADGQAFFSEDMAVLGCVDEGESSKRAFGVEGPALTDPCAVLLIRNALFILAIRGDDEVNRVAAPMAAGPEALLLPAFSAIMERLCCKEGGSSFVLKKQQQMDREKNGKDGERIKERRIRRYGLE